MPSAEVAARAGDTLQIALETELGLQVVSGARPHRLLDQPKGLRRAGGEAPRQRHGLAHELGVGIDFVDDAHAVKIVGSHLIGGEHERKRKLRPDDARQEPGAAGIRHERDPGESFLQIRAARSHDQVAGERQIGGGADRRPVERGDRHLGVGVEPDGERIVVAIEPPAEVDLAVGSGEALLGKVLSRREGAAVAGDNEASYGVVGFGGGQRVAQVRMHSRRDGVELLGSRERDRGNAVRGVVTNCRVAHRSNLRARRRGTLAEASMRE